MCYECQIVFCWWKKHVQVHYSHVTMIILLSLTETTGDTLDYHFHLIFFLLCSNTYQSSKTLRDSFVLVPSHITLMHMTNMKVANMCFVMVQFQVSCKNAPTFLPVDTNSTVNEPCHISSSDPCCIKTSSACGPKT